MRLVVSVFLVAALLGSGGALAGPTLDAIKSRGELVCGIRGETIGFAHQEPNGTYAGFDVDMCRMVAAAILGDARKVKFVSLEPEGRFDALKNGQVDMLASGTAFTLSRDVSFGFEFPAVYFFDTQAFMALRKHGKKSAKEMKNASVCVQSKTVSERHAREWGVINKMNFKFVEFPTLPELRKAFFEGKCDLYTADRSAVYAARQVYAPAPNEYQIFPDAISQEPLSLVVRKQDQEFAAIVRWSFNALVMADTYDVTMRNVDEMIRSDNPVLQRLLGVTPGVGAKLRVDEKWAYTIIKQVGSFSDIYDRNLGDNSPLKVPKALNTQASVGGMLYPFPLR